jgi:hypothetical protein
MSAIVITFAPTSLGRVEFDAEVMTADRLSLDTVKFKLDTGSDFTTLSLADLHLLGYSDTFLQSCPVFGEAITPAGEVTLQYIEHISLKLGDREIQDCRIFFALGSPMRSIFGCDILKYFNYAVDFDKGEFLLNKTDRVPALSFGETPIQIYSINT